MPAEQILERLMKEYGDSIFRMCYLCLKDYYLAEDAMQETFIKAMRFYDSFLHKSNEKTWLMRIAINCCKNIMRKQWFRLPMLNIEDHQQVDDKIPIEELLERDSLTKAIMSLRKSDRQIIILYYYQELSVKEISAIVGKKENAINQQLKRARERLKRFLKETDYGTKECQNNY